MQISHLSQHISQLFVSSMSMNFFEILTASAKPQNDSGMSLRVITVIARAQPVAISRGNPKPGQGLEVEYIALLNGNF